MLDINEIKDFLPHRFPILLVDRILELEPGRRATGIKNITANDFYNHHDYFNEDSLFPGALQVEAMAQVAIFLIRELIESQPNRIFLFASIDKARFRKTSRPGDKLRIDVELKKFKGGIAKFQAKSFLDDEIASEVKFTGAIVPVE